jgi:glycine oxidase
VRGVRVDALEADGRLQATRRADGQVHDLVSRDVVLAGGSWSNVGLRGVAAHLPLRPVKGQILRLHGAALLHRVVRTPDIYLIPHRAGHLIVGASVEEQGFDHVPTAGATFDLLRHAWRALPGIYDVSLQEINVGFRPTIRDHRPVIGRLGGTRVVVATGHYRNGILQAAGTARLVADLVCDGTDSPWLRAFSPDRFAAASVAPHDSATARAAGATHAAGATKSSGGTQSTGAVSLGGD